jgi:predicted MFS family arabinose efflux permease
MTPTSPSAAASGAASPADAATAAAPRSRQEILLLTVLSCCAALVFLNRGGIAFLFPVLKPALHLNNVQLGQLMAVTALSWAVSSVLGSVVSDAFGVRARTLLVFCVLGFSLVGGLAGAVSTFPALLALRAAMGVFEGPVIPLIQSTVSAISPAQRRGANLGLIIGGSGLVTALVAPPLMAYLAGGVGWRFAFLAIAAPGPLIAVAIWIVMRGAGAPGGGLERLDLGAALKLASRRNVLLGMIGAITLIGGTVAYSSFFPLYMSSLSAFPASSRLLVLMAMGVTTGLGSILTPALSDRFGRKPCLIAAALCTAAFPVAIVLMSVSPLWTIAAVVLHLFGAGALTLMVYVIPGETVPARMAASTFAVLLCVGEIVGGATSPAVAGWVADRQGLAGAMWVCAGLGAIALLGSFFVRDPAPHQPHRRAEGEPLVALPEGAA